MKFFVGSISNFDSIPSSSASRSVCYGTEYKATIYFVRHAESRANALRMAIPPQNDLLTECGRHQAELVGRHLCQDREKLTAAFSSPYPKAMETAEIILSRWNHGRAPGDQVTLNLVESPRPVKTKNPAGKWEDELFKRNSGDSIWNPEGAESPEELRGRLRSLCKDIFEVIDRRKSSVEDTILVVTDCSLRPLLKMWAEDPLSYRLTGSIKSKPEASGPSSLSSSSQPRSFVYLKVAVEVCPNSRGWKPREIQLVKDVCCDL